MNPTIDREPFGVASIRFHNPYLGVSIGGQKMARIRNPVAIWREYGMQIVGLIVR